MSSYQYRKYHCGDKTVLWWSYLHNGISYTGKTASLYWIRTLGSEQNGSLPSALLMLNTSVFTLTHWGRVTQICVGKLTNIGSDNGLSPGRRQAIIWTNAGILLIGPLGTNFSEFLIVIHTSSFNKMHLKMSSAKWRPFCFGLNVLTLCLLQDLEIYGQAFRVISD